jgi:enamine deaminase RidA (YjgF/YER057c/UK114 family)
LPTRPHVVTLIHSNSLSYVAKYAYAATAPAEARLIFLAGASAADVISTRVLVASARREDLVAAWNVIRESFGPHDVSSTLMGVTVLGYAEQLVEIEAIAAVLDS